MTKENIILNNNIINYNVINYNNTIFESSNLNNNTIFDSNNFNNNTINDKNTKLNNDNLNYSVQDKNLNSLNNENLYDFVSVFTDGRKGPITINRKESNEYKENIYELVSPNLNKEFESFYHDKENFENLKKFLKRNDEYFCELNVPNEGSKGYYLSCPSHYTIVIDDSFYGRYFKDIDHCTVYPDGSNAPLQKYYIKETCGKNVKSKVNELCTGRIECNIKPNSQLFSDPCKDKIKYLHVKYHCIKNHEFKKPKIAIVTFVSNIEVNSIYEHAISDLYQYSDIHGYKLIVNRDRYDKERDIYYMKSHVLIDAIIYGLKTKEYDWVFWIDADCIIANPNIKIESFIPFDNKIHLVAASDQNGFNAGVLLFRVHEWSLSILYRAFSYAYFNKDKYLIYADQTSLNNVLTINSNEKDHYIIVPQSWFNNYPDKMKSGDFIIHFAGLPNKNVYMEETLDRIKKDSNYLTSKTNMDMREEVLEYYNLPKNEQLNINYDN